MSKVRDQIGGQPVQLQVPTSRASPVPAVTHARDGAWEGHTDTKALDPAEFADQNHACPAGHPVEDRHAQA